MSPESFGNKWVRKGMVDLNTQEVMEVRIAEPGPSY